MGRVSLKGTPAENIPCVQMERTSSEMHFGVAGFLLDVAVCWLPSLPDLTPQGQRRGRCLKGLASWIPCGLTARGARLTVRSFTARSEDQTKRAQSERGSGPVLARAAVGWLSRPSSALARSTLAGIPAVGGGRRAAS